MVRGRYVRNRQGKRVWQEDPPPPCPNGHREQMTGHGACPKCGVMGRVYRCKVCDKVTVDPEHVHQT